MRSEPASANTRIVRADRACMPCETALSKWHRARMRRYCGWRRAVLAVSETNIVIVQGWLKCCNCTCRNSRQRDAWKLHLRSAIKEDWARRLSNILSRLKCNETNGSSNSFCTVMFIYILFCTWKRARVCILRRTETRGYRSVYRELAAFK